MTGCHYCDKYDMLVCDRALQEAQDIFGVDFDFDEFEQYDEDEDDEDIDDDVSRFSSLYCTVSHVIHHCTVTSVGLATSSAM